MINDIDIPKLCEWLGINLCSTCKRAGRLELPHDEWSGQIFAPLTDANHDLIVRDAVFDMGSGRTCDHGSFEVQVTAIITERILQRETTVESRCNTSGAYAYRAGDFTRAAWAVYQEKIGEVKISKDETYEN